MLKVGFVLLAILGLVACGSSSHEGPALQPPRTVGQDPAQVLNFETVRGAVFAPHCVGCHKSFNDYARVAGRLVEIADAIALDEMPKNAPPLSPELKAMLSKWIDLGAPEF